MPIKTNITQTEDLKNILPIHSRSSNFFFVDHWLVIQYLRTQLDNHGFKIRYEQFRSNSNHQIVNGIFYLEHAQIDDPEYAPLFVWTNSYERSRGFKCTMGIYNKNTEEIYLSDDTSSSMEDGDTSPVGSMLRCIVEQIDCCEQQFKHLTALNLKLDNINITSKKRSEIVGHLFFDVNILGVSQVSLIKKDLDGSGDMYSSGVVPAHYLYKVINNTFNDSHPSKWMEDHGVTYSLMEELVSNHNKKKLIPVPRKEPVRETHKPLVSKVVFK